MEQPAWPLPQLKFIYTQRRARQASVPARVNLHWYGEGSELTFPYVAAAAATVGSAVDSNRYIRCCCATTSCNLAWAVDKRYLLVLIKIFWLILS